MQKRKSRDNQHTYFFFILGLLLDVAEEDPDAMFADLKKKKKKKSKTVEDVR